MKQSFPVFQQIFLLLRQHPRIVTALVVTSFFSVLAEGLGIGLIIPLIQPSLADGYLDQIPQMAGVATWLDALTLVQRIRVAVIVLVTVVIVRSLFVMGAHFFTYKLQQQILLDLRKRVFRQIHEVELRFFYRQRLGGMITTLLDHVVQIEWLFQGVCRAIPACLAVLVYLGLMVAIAGPITLLAAGLLVGTLLLSNRLFSQPLRRLGAAEQQGAQNVYTIVLESLSAMKLLHLFRKESVSIQQLGDALDTYQNDMFRGRFLNESLMPFFSIFSVVILGAGVLLFTTAAQEVIESWLGVLAVFLAFTLRIVRPARQVNHVSGLIIKQAPAFQSVMRFIDRSDKPYMPDGSIAFEHLSDSIVFEHVDFRYGNEAAYQDTQEGAHGSVNQGIIEKNGALEESVVFEENDESNNVLKDVCITIPHRKMTALVGPSGAGKSTIVDLVARLHDCDAGRIAVDGLDVREFTLTSWRGALAVVSQDTFLFNDTVWANLRFVKPNATDEEIRQAVRFAQAETFIEALPQGYDTFLGDRGVLLSGGQQQRIAIARAILTNPQILILDEATSDLDSETERALQKAIEEFGQERTLLVIAHRLSTIQAADNIVVLDEGRVVEEGSHDALMVQKGHYWRLVQAQKLTNGSMIAGDRRRHETMKPESLAIPV